MAEDSFQIAIDGPVGSGKSTVTRLVAERLRFLYVDTGAMYRAVALLGLRVFGASFTQEQIMALLEKSRIEIRSPHDSERDGRLITVLLDGEDVSWLIRTQEISTLVPVVAAMPFVRRSLVALQQEISKKHAVVMEGRDITYRVLPNAQLKIYLTASPLERAQRRHSQMQSKGEDVSLEEVLADIQKRDDSDMSRSTDPLKIVEGVWVLDTTGMTIDEVVDVICAQAVEKMSV